MQRVTVGILLCALCSALVPRPAAGQDADVRGALEETVRAWTEARVSDFVQQFDPQVRGFYLDGALLTEGVSREATQARYDAGFKVSMELRHVDVRLYGNTAVLAGYMVGWVSSGGITDRGTWRFTEVRVNQEGRWRVVQYHFSKLKS